MTNLLINEEVEEVTIVMQPTMVWMLQLDRFEVSPRLQLPSCNRRSCWGADSLALSLPLPQPVGEGVLVTISSPLLCSALLTSPHLPLRRNSESHQVYSELVHYHLGHRF